MRFHTNTATRTDVYEAAHSIGVVADVTNHGSRTHERALEISLTGFGEKRRTARRPNYWHKNPNPEVYAATWDEWGVVLAHLFSVDPGARIGSVAHPDYDGAEDFHFKTGDRFAGTGMPADTHDLHHWRFVAPGTHACTVCSAVRRYNPR